MDLQSPDLSTAVATLLTPVVIAIWSKAFPVQDSSEFFLIDYETLKKRNGWIDAVATVFMFIGIAIPIALHRYLAGAGMWIVGLVFGLMVILHFLWVCVATLPSGTQRFREYWRFYELRWGIGILGIKVIYIPIGTLALFSAAMIWL